MFGMLILQAVIVVLVGVVLVVVRNHFRKAQLHKKVVNQIKEENRIWDEILKQKDIKKA